MNTRDALPYTQGVRNRWICWCRDDRVHNLSVWRVRLSALTVPINKSDVQFLPLLHTTTDDSSQVTNCKTCTFSLTVSMSFLYRDSCDGIISFVGSSYYSSCRVQCTVSLVGSTHHRACPLCNSVRSPM
jgi:hypothetical protein